MVNIHLLLVALILVFTATAKLVSGIGDAPALSASDPLLPMTNGQLFLLVGLVEFLVVGYLLAGGNNRFKHLLVLWLSLNFAGYRLGVWWVGGDKPCSCLGTIFARWPVDAELVDGLLKVALAYMFIGSLYCLSHQPVVLAISRLSEQARRRLRRAVTVTVILAVFPAVQVGCVAVLDPPTTGPILVREITRWSSGSASPPVSYIWKDAQAIPDVCLKVLLAAEDNRFVEHAGFSWRHVRFALLEAKAAGTPPRGASTITQQCARSVFLWQGRSWIRKGLEAYYTIWMELLLSKQRILELYANVIELGDGVYGLEAGARHHFGIPCEHLTEEQAALLAAILPNPKAWKPNEPNETVLQRRELILRQAGQMRLPSPHHR